MDVLCDSENRELAALFVLVVESAQKGLGHDFHEDVRPQVDVLASAERRRQGFDRLPSHAMVSLCQRVDGSFEEVLSLVHVLESLEGLRGSLRLADLTGFRASAPLVALISLNWRGLRYLPVLFREVVCLELGPDLVDVSPAARHLSNSNFESSGEPRRLHASLAVSLLLKSPLPLSCH